MWGFMNTDNPDEPNEVKLPDGRTMRTEDIKEDGEDGDFTITFSIF